MPSVEATVTTRPARASSQGIAARTTAAVPSRLTATTRSQSSAGTSSRRPHASIPAAVTTADSPPARSASAFVARSAARPSERSTCWDGTSRSGRFRSSTSGLPPLSDTAVTTAAPSPDAPPVTSTLPSSPPTRAHLLDQPGGRTAGDEGQDRDLAALALHHLGLGDRRRVVVAPLRVDVRAKRLQHGHRGVAVEGDDGVHALQRGQ